MLLLMHMHPFASFFVLVFGRLTEDGWEVRKVPRGGLREVIIGFFC